MKKLVIAFTAASVAMTPGAAMAQRYHKDWNQVQAYDWNHPEPGYNTYYADRYYRSGNYPEHNLARDERIYRGHDGRYYCRHNDGTTGLVVGAAAGALLGNALRVGGSSTLSTILGGVAGAAIGSSVDRGNLRCR